MLHWPGLLSFVLFIYRRKWSVTAGFINKITRFIIDAAFSSYEKCPKLTSIHLCSFNQRKLQASHVIVSLVK